MSQFDHCIDRTKTPSIKWSLAQHKYAENTLPLWVADMDFITAPAIIEALQQAATEGVYGYTVLTDRYIQAALTWSENRHHYHFEPEWLLTNYGVVMSIAIAIQAFTEANDAILIQTPVYHPFANTIKANQRKVVTSSLKLTEQDYQMDFVDFEQKIVSNQVKLFILCSPHNPVGRVWTHSELETIAAICLKHNVLVVADEIHADFVYAPHVHTVFSSLSSEIEQQTILCTSASKTFNLAGLQVSNTIIANPTLRQRYKQQLETISFHNANEFGLRATQAAYEHGAEWLDELLTYLKGNIDYLTTFFKEYLPQFPVLETQGSYLMWVDFRSLQLAPKALNDFLLKEVGLWLNSGEIFGDEGEGFQRVNIATQRSTIIEACQRLHDKLKEGGFLID